MGPRVNNTTLTFVALDDSAACSRQFRAGDTRLHHKQWMTITSDKFILQTVAEATLEFDESPIRGSKPCAINFSHYECECIDKELDKFLQFGIVERVEHSHDEFISNIFIRDKKDGSHRVILNLLELNQFIAYHHFKMDTIDTVINLMRPDCVMASVDLSNAYYSIPIAKAHRKYLRFEWRGELYEFKVLPNGMSAGPRMFTKVLKPVYAHLRQMGHSGLEINISRQWTIGPLALKIWWSCQISGGPDLANNTIILIKSNTADRIYLLPCTRHLKIPCNR